MASNKVWFAKDAVLKISGTPVTLGTTDTVANLISSTGTWSSRVKNVRIEQGTRDIEPINVMGVQQLKQENRPEIVSLTFNTAMYPQGLATDATLFSFLFGVGTALTGSGAGYIRYQGGEKTSNDRSDMAVLVTMSRPGGAVTDTVHFLLNNATTTAGPVTLDAEGHAEQEWTVKCLAVDFYIDTGVSANPET